LAGFCGEVCSLDCFGIAAGDMEESAVVTA
jgi:hypothetical protein